MDAGLVTPVVPSIVAHVVGLRRDLNVPKRGTAALAPARKRGAYVLEREAVALFDPKTKRESFPFFVGHTGLLRGPLCHRSGDRAVPARLV